MLNLTANDLDSSGVNSQVLYRLSHPSYLFNIDINTGMLYASQSNISAFTNTYKFADYSYTSIVIATDCGLPSLSSQTEVKVTLIPPANLYSPVFVGGSSIRAVSVPEDAAVGSSVTRVTATDADTGVNGQVTYSITGGTGQQVFKIGSTDGYVKLAQPLNAQFMTSYNLTIQATDGAFYFKSASLTLAITVTRANNHSPVFSLAIYNCTTRVDTPIGGVVCQVTASDYDIPPFNAVSYSLIGQSIAGVFSLDSQTGMITVNQQLSSHSANQYELIVKAVDAQNIYSSQAIVGIKVLSVNKHAPVFTNSTYYYNVTSSAPIGTLVGYVTATDSDWGLFGQCQYYLVGDSHLQGLSLDPNSGALTVNSDLARQVASILVLDVVAANLGVVNGNWTDACSVVLLVRGSGNAPYFLQSLYSATIMVDAPVGTPVLTVTAAETGSPSVTFTYMLVAGNTDGTFSIDNTGLIRTATAISRDVGSVYQLSVVAADSNIPPLSGTTLVKVSVQAASGQQGPYFIPRVPLGVVEEGLAPLSITILSLSRYTFDSSSQSSLTYTYALINCTDVFTVQASDGTVMAKMILSSIMMSSYVVGVAVTNSATPPLTSYLAFQVNVLSAILPSPRPMVIGVTALGGTLPAGMTLTDVGPLIGGSTSPAYSCTGGDAQNFIIVTGCQLQVGLSPAPSGTYIVHVTATDGVHSVTYDVNITLTSVTLTAVNTGATTLLVDNVTSVQSFVNSSFTQLMTSLQRVVSADVTLVVCDVSTSLKGGVFVTLIATQSSGTIVVTSSTLVSWLSPFVGSIASSSGVNIVSISYDPCVNVTCLNGGHCLIGRQASGDYHVTGGTYVALATPSIVAVAQCQCPAGYTGMQCQSVVPTCATLNCQHGGTCTLTAGVPKCSCLIGWTGTSCDSDVDECQSSSACPASSAVCVNTVGSYTCLSKTCTSLACQQGGTCHLDNSNTPHCLCTPAAYGQYCERTSTNFGPLSYQQYASSFGQATDSVSIEFATLQTDALLVYIVAGQSDFMAVEVVDGQVRLTYSHTNISPVIVYTTHFVSDGSWHRVEATRSGQVNII